MRHRDFVSEREHERGERERDERGERERGHDRKDIGVPGAILRDKRDSLYGIEDNLVRNKSNIERMGDRVMEAINANLENKRA